MPSTFRTKRGRCHLDGDWLRLESSLRGQWRRYREGGRLPALLMAGTVFGVVVILVEALLTGDVRRLLLMAGVVVALVAVARLSNYVRGFTAAEEIPVDAISHVTAKQGTKGLTRPRFVVTYEVSGETKRRYVMMPSLWLSYGADEFRRAKAAFRDAGIAVE
ncbi:hypothetical protein [Haloplanus natans]|uniref:hypothetical protein n=1 Tax=Haloplanus natans TaxID=376171 RepID=UPI000677F002|nr:hypothetical protein [Haloplanus natans]